MSLLDSLNNARLPLGSTRQPRCSVTVNGATLTGVIEAEVTNASHFTSDTFRIVAATGGLPPGLGPDYWASSVGDQIGVNVAFADNLTPATQLILGQVDTAEYDAVKGTMTLSGRDLSAQLIDSKTSEKFQNKRSYEIAQILALRHGLDSNVDKTIALAGTYYNIDHVVLTQEQTEWDLLVYLAKQEGFDIWVSGTTLFFKPSPVDSAPPYKVIAPGSSPSNVVDIKLSRSQTLAKDVIVKIRSWNQKQQRPFTVTYKVTQAFKSQRTGGKSQEYSYTVPNLSRDQALKLAKSTAEDITRHERVLDATLPGDNLLTTRAQVQLIGTGTVWDQKYYPDTVTRRISAHEGYLMTLRAKNHSTQSTVVIG